MITFQFPWPKKWYRTGKYSGQLKDNAPIEHTIKPDIDNLLKFVMDAMKNNKYGGIVTRGKAHRGFLEYDGWRNGMQMPQKEMWTTTKEFVANEALEWKMFSKLVERYFKIELGQDEKNWFEKNFTEK